jgi:hypothetical protein
MDINDVIIKDNISLAWKKAFKHVNSSPQKRSSLLIIINNLDNETIEEDVELRELIDQILLRHNKFLINTVANTIFPQSLWNKNKDRKVLFDRYLKCWPRIERCKSNRKGTYFSRFINYPDGVNNGNQLDYIIDKWFETRFRRSALQLNVFDPRGDHINTPYLLFPCLDHVVFKPIGAKGRDGLTLTALYATQSILEKAYGNWLGLIRLGQFVAYELSNAINEHIQLKQIVCIANNAILRSDSDISLTDITEVVYK